MLVCEAHRLRAVTGHRSNSAWTIALLAWSVDKAVGTHGGQENWCFLVPPAQQLLFASVLDFFLFQSNRAARFGRTLSVNGRPND